MIEIAKPIEFTYAAGKVGGLGGYYIDGGLVSMGEPAASVNFNADGTGLIVLTVANSISPFNWYTGGVPSGTTTFQVDVTTFNDSSNGNVVTTHGVGTHYATNNLTVGIYMQGAPGIPVTSTLVFTVHITRGSATVSHNYTLQLMTEL